MRHRTLIAAALVLLAGLFPVASAGGGVEVTYLANEGFLVRVGETTMLFDAFLEKEMYGYPALEEPTLEALRGARPPFDAVDVAFATHEHEDHVQADPAIDFLEASPRTPLVTTRGVVALLAEAAGAELTPPLRLEAMRPERGQSLRLEHGPVVIDALGVPHDTDRFRDLDHVAFLVEVEGTRILHVGDAGAHLEVFAPYALGKRGIDVAFMPYWFLLSESGVKLLVEEIKARWIVPMHVPGRDLEGLIRTLAGDSMPKNVVFFENVPGTRTFEPAGSDD